MDIDYACRFVYLRLSFHIGKTHGLASRDRLGFDLVL